MSAKLLLIAGFPNSGTTITAMILGQHPQTFATGELTDFPEKRQFADHNTCSCGRKKGIARSGVACGRTMPRGGAVTRGWSS